MGGELEVEDRRAIGVAEEAVVSEEAGDGGYLRGLQLLACEEVAQGAHLTVDDDTQRDGFVVEVLDDEGLVVVGEEGDLRRSFDIGAHVLAHGTTDDVQGTCGIVVEVAEVVGDGQDEEHALGIGVAQEDGVA